MRPHLQASWHTRSVLFWFVIASVPAAAVGVWNLGRQVLLAVHGGAVEEFGGWRAALVALVDPAVPEGEPLIAALLGLSYLVPLALVTLATSAFWALVFARARHRPLDPGWLMSGWLLALLLPPAVTPIVAALAMSFGAIVGQHIFGGSGRYIVSPALLGALFVHFSYPAFAQLALPFDSGLTSGWLQVVGGGIGGQDWVAHLLGTAPGGIASGSALACLAGAAVLVAVRVASWRVLAGAIAGLFAASQLVAWSAESTVADLPWYWHLVLGNLAFALAFLATDPSAAPITRTGRWLFGAAIGVLTVLIRTLDPAHPEGTLFAVLLAGLALPLIDHLVLRRYRAAEEQP